MRIYNRLSDDSFFRRNPLITYVFDEYAEQYDRWFLQNRIVLESELSLFAYFLKDPGRALSVGCGSGLFEMLLKSYYGVSIEEGVEPARHMAEIARKRGMMIKIGSAESLDYNEDEFDTLIYNGTPSYIADLKGAFEEGYRVLKSSGHIVVLDVPKESSYALLYNLAMVLGDWDHPLLQGIAPIHPYPIEFVKSANWRTTKEKIDILEQVGFKNLKFAQTLTRHPVYTNDSKEEAIEGYDRGDYVAICGEK